MKFRYAFLICMVFLVILTIGFASASDNSTSTDRDISKETFIKVINETVPPKFLEMNLKAFELGYNYKG